MNESKLVAKPRIREPGILLFAGLVALGFAVLCSLAAAGGGTGAAVVAGFFLLIAGAALGAVFWVQLFRKIELRLMDIEAKLAPPARSAPADDGVDGRNVG